MYENQIKNIRINGFKSINKLKSTKPLDPECIIIDMLGETREANNVRRHVFSCGAFRITLRLGGLHFTQVPYIDQIRAKFKNLLSLSQINKLVERLYARLENLLFPVPLSDLLICGGAANCAGLAKSVNYAHSFDYELWRRFNSSPDKFNRYSLFLDEDIVHHADYIRFGLQPPVTEWAYYKAMNHFFDEYEKVSGLPVYVAAHPSSDYSLSHKLWKGRHLVKEQTLEAVASASRVFVHYSTSISYAILLKKPITHLVSNEMLTSFMGPQVVGVNKFLKTSLVNIDLKFDWTVEQDELAINADRYDEYINLYLKKNGTQNAPLWEIISDFIDLHVASSKNNIEPLNL
jgi:hypothetical protein